MCEQCNEVGNRNGLFIKTHHGVGQDLGGRNIEDVHTDDEEG